MILVTGAGGFVGGTLVRRLVGDGRAVRALVRGAPDSATSVALRAAGATVVYGDVREPGTLRAAVQGCTHVAHLAAQKSRPGTSLAQYRASNVEGTRHVLRAAQACRVERLVYASTLGVHGYVDGEILDEESPIRPNTLYRFTKYEGERVLREQPPDGRIQTVVARLSTAVGAGARSWAALIRSVQVGSLRLIGDGANHIDLVSVDDMADALSRCLFVPGIDGRDYVIGSGGPVTLRRFTGIIAEELGVRAPAAGPPRWPYALLMRHTDWLPHVSARAATFVHQREPLVADKRASSARAARELGYDPASSIDEAIRCMTREFQAAA